jgi:hypothetical protein
MNRETISLPCRALLVIAACLLSANVDQPMSSERSALLGDVANEPAVRSALDGAAVHGDDEDRGGETYDNVPKAKRQLGMCIRKLPRLRRGLI